MISKTTLSALSDHVIEFGFAALLVLVPLIYFEGSYELFEYNKMMLTFALTALIVGAWITKMITAQKIIFTKTFLFLPIILFLMANLLSTYFSIDQHVSIFGYYSRSNGGLLSTIAYIALYFAVASNIKKSETIRQLLFLSVLSACLVALWGVMQHYGIDADQWIQDVKARVFSTLGQPNWLAAYLAMVLPVALAFFVNSSSRYLKIFLLALCASLYAAFIFTYSRGGALGLSAGLLVFAGTISFALSSRKFPKMAIVASGLFLLSLASWLFYKTHPLFIYAPLVSLILLSCSFTLNNWKEWRWQAGLSFIFITLTILFANPASYRLDQGISVKGEAESQTLQPGSTSSSSPLSLTPLPLPAETANIRLIVWQGALDIWRHYPILGSGVETFAFSYYQFRPPAHNLTTEWDFLYNKAHNEYLNYLATTGVVGLGVYLLMIVTFIVWFFKSIVNNESGRKLNSSFLILNSALLAGYIAYLFQNIVSFSVVAISVLFWLYPALAYVLHTANGSQQSAVSGKHQGGSKNNSVRNRVSLVTGQLSKKQLLLIILVLGACILVLSALWRAWWADNNFNTGYSSSRAGNLTKSFEHLLEAVQLNPLEPFYHSELAYTASALSYEVKESSLSAQLEILALSEANRATTTSPNSLSYQKNLINVYINLSDLDPAYLPEAKHVYEKTIQLAPTDAKTYYNYARFLWTTGEKEQSIDLFKKTVELKPNWRDARLSLADHLRETGQIPAALDQLRYILTYIDANDQLAREKLAAWSAKE